MDKRTLVIQTHWEHPCHQKLVLELVSPFSLPRLCCAPSGYSLATFPKEWWHWFFGIWNNNINLHHHVRKYCVSCVLGLWCCRLRIFQLSRSQLISLTCILSRMEDGRMEQDKDVFMLLVLVGCRLAVVGKDWLFFQWYRVLRYS